MATHTEAVGEEKHLPKHGDKKIQCVVVTPEKSLLDDLVDFVALPLYDGELGVLPGRTPLIGRLGYGELRTNKGDQIERYFIEGGFAQVRDDVVTVLTQRAIPAAEVDPTATAQELEAAESRRATSDHDRAEREKAIARARGMMRVARHKA